ncbi:hypothetical protein [Sinimarinibacterium sp. NLF-5-8]|uniref:hypothetical protein n=1 Tax=Sinimarinibacterium sp. NLF-5-8 TaxID=2698684 RepID=UPI00137BA648|nr:hypothetical protein [Sinimarinibacterium sp. NLF-5-8]QHS10370.1 hypothetical protein GT972_09640 [Sinimarinibacterium sp. NLF-5-8]
MGRKNGEKGAHCSGSARFDRLAMAAGASRPSPDRVLAIKLTILESGALPPAMD